MPAVKPMDPMPCNMGNPLASTSMHVMPSNVMYRVNADNPLNLMSHCSTDPPTVNPTPSTSMHLMPSMDVDNTVNINSPPTQLLIRHLVR